MSFVIGERYSRQYIHDELGGELETYLPQEGWQDRLRMASSWMTTRVCLTRSSWGSGAVIKRKAGLFIAQRWYIPVFLQGEESDWEYVGEYRVQGINDDLTLIERKQKEANRTKVSRVLLPGAGAVLE